MNTAQSLVRMGLLKPEGKGTKLGEGEGTKLGLGLLPFSGFLL